MMSATRRMRMHTLLFRGLNGRIETMMKNMIFTSYN
nr:MAG TPA: hypothetical protein [Caudoviricetes sp.]